MHTQSKTWSDRADKDLFFTILQIKNIGVISGPEWTVVGEHMRRMGYTFTNEGCRQHFQGLRRTQMKADAEGTATAGSVAKRVADPSENPITRRPGPGRGTPRYKGRNNDGSPIVPVPSANAPSVATSQAPSSNTAVPVSVTSGPSLALPPGSGAVPHASMDAASTAGPRTFPSPPRDAFEEGSAEMSMVGLAQHVGSASGMVLPAQDADAEGDAEEDADGEDEPSSVEEPMAKRQRLDPGELSHAGAMDDDNLLQLAAHSHGATGDQYGAEYHYGEA